MPNFPPYQFSAWINPTGDSTKPLSRCINVWSDDADFYNKIISNNKDLGDTIFLQITAPFRCENAGNGA